MEKTLFQQLTQKQVKEYFTEDSTVFSTEINNYIIQYGYDTGTDGYFVLVYDNLNDIYVLDIPENTMESSEQKASELLKEIQMKNREEIDFGVFKK